MSHGNRRFSHLYKLDCKPEKSLTNHPLKNLKMRGTRNWEEPDRTKSSESKTKQVSNVSGNLDTNIDKTSSPYVLGETTGTGRINGEEKYEKTHLEVQCSEECRRTRSRRVKSEKLKRNDWCREVDSRGSEDKFRGGWVPEFSRYDLKWLKKERITSDPGNKTVNPTVRIWEFIKT